MDSNEDDSLTRQMLNMVLENNAIRDTVYPYMLGWILFNLVILSLLIYISVKLSSE
jgi:hypothetical protein